MGQRKDTRRRDGIRRIQQQPTGLEKRLQRDKMNSQKKVQLSRMGIRASAIRSCQRTQFWCGDLEEKPRSKLPESCHVGEGRCRPNTLL